MSAALAWLRGHTSTLTREQIYGFAVLIIGGSGIVSGVDGRLEAALITTVTSALVLALAALNSRALMATLYVFLGSVAGLGQVIAVVYDGVGWVVWIGYGAGLLGTVLAFFRVPTTSPGPAPAVVGDTLAVIADRTGVGIPPLIAGAAVAAVAQAGQQLRDAGIDVDLPAELAGHAVAYADRQLRDAGVWDRIAATETERAASHRAVEA